MAKQADNNNEATSGRDVQARFKPLTDQTLAEYTDSGSFARGHSYFRNDYIIEVVLRGSILRGKCLGQSGGPYTVQAILVTASDKDIKAIRDYDCSCPRGGFCKHIVALLLTWIHKPDDVEVRAEIASVLQDKSRDELLAVIVSLLKRDPDLDGAIEKMLLAAVPKTTAPGAANKLTINASKIRKQAAAAFASGYDREWGESGANTDDLEALVEAGDSYVKAGQWANALAIYSAVAEACIDHYEEIDDENGEVGEIILDCKDGLAECLQAQDRLDVTDRLSPETRLSLFRSLFDIWEHESDYGYGDGYEKYPQFNRFNKDAEEREDKDDDSEEDDGEGDFDTDTPDLILRAATPVERREVASWLQIKIDQTRGKTYGPPRRLIDFLISLKQKDGLPDEQLLDEYRKAGMFGEVATRLLQRGQTEEALAEYQNAGLYQEMATLLVQLERIHEAIAIARKHLTQPDRSTQFADLLLSRDDQWQADALKFVEDRLWEERNSQNVEHYLRWLEARYTQFGKAKEALEIAQRRFRSNPNNQTYLAVKQAATMPDQPDDVWAKTRPALIAKLGEKGEWGGLAILHLSEGAVGDALDALAALEAAKPKRQVIAGYGYGYPDRAAIHLKSQVAQAAEKDYPDRARSIYARLAEEYIAGRQRDYYQEAAKYVQKVKALYTSEDKQADWQAYITDLRARYKALRALKDELDRAGLN